MQQKRSFNAITTGIIPHPFRDVFRAPLREAQDTLVRYGITMWGRAGAGGSPVFSGLDCHFQDDHLSDEG